MKLKTKDIAVFGSLFYGHFDWEDCEDWLVCDFNGEFLVGGIYGKVVFVIHGASI